MSNDGDQRLMKFDDGLEMTVAAYSNRMTWHIGDLWTMAAGMDEWANTLDYYLAHLKTAVAEVQTAAGYGESGMLFVKGDPTHDGYEKSAQQTFDSISALSANLRAQANHPEGGLRASADRMFETEQANLRLFGVAAEDPRTPPGPGAPA